MAGLTKETKFDVHKFDFDMQKMLRMDTQCDVEERRFRLLIVLVTCIAGNKLEGIAGEYWE